MSGQFPPGSHSEGQQPQDSPPPSPDNVWAPRPQQAPVPPPAAPPQPDPSLLPPPYGQQPYGDGQHAGHFSSPIPEPRPPKPRPWRADLTNAGLLYPGAPQTLIDAVQAGAPVRAARWGVPDFAITFALWLFFSLVAGVIGLVIFGEAGISDPPPSLIILSLALPWVGLAGWPIAITYWRGNGPKIDFGLTFRLSDLGWGVLYGVGALAAAGIIGLITTALFGEFDSAVGEIVSGITNIPMLIIIAIMIGVGAPVIEELAYRGLLLGSLAKRGWLVWAAVPMSAFIFAAAHFEPIRFPLLFAIGLVLGFARWHRRSTTVAIIGHACVNIPGAISLFFV